MRTAFLQYCLIILLALLASCTGQPSKPAAEKPAVTSADQIQELLNRADESESPQREELQLQAVRLLLGARQLSLASQIIASIQPQPLSPELYARYAELLARLHIERGLYEEARIVLEAPRVTDNLDTLPLAQQIDIGLLRAQVYSRLGKHIASAQQRIYLAPLLSGEQRRENQRAIWQSLMHVPLDELQHYQAQGFSSDYQGWLALAYIARENQGDLDQQVQQLEQWQQQWPDHPANSDLPDDLKLIRKLAENRPRQVALLLPLTGRLAPFGKAVRDGFIAARYQTQQNGGQVPVLKIYDTENHPDFYDLYQQAVRDGAQLVIGPLEKQRLKILFQQMSLPVPTLALNRGEDFGLPPLNLYQFGLAPQDEAREVADIAYLQNHHRAMLISPRGEWGDKVSEAFSDRWQALGGTVATSSIYSGQQDYSNSIKRALLLDLSEKREKRIQQLAGEHLEFTPRRREDIDMVFLLARPQQARSLKPLLAYHYAGDLPVYGTSRLYTGYDDPKRDRDIEGVMFTDMPWVLNTPSELHKEINEELQHSKQYERMYALGVDSFQLYPRLRQLEEIPNSRVYGQTGTLKLNSQNEIERELLFAQIHDSRAQLIPMVDQSPNLTASTEGAKHEKEKQL